MKPFYVTNLIDALSLPPGAKGYEQTFLKMAGEQHKEVLGISTIEKESELLDGITMEDQVKTLYKAMFPNRHAIWIPEMKAHMQNHSCFFAVGVGHLAGKEGIIELLRNEGFTVLHLVQ